MSQPARDTLHDEPACARFSKCAENDIFLTKNRKRYTNNPISRRESHLSGILYDHLVLSCAFFDLRLIYLLLSRYGRH